MRISRRTWLRRMALASPVGVGLASGGFLPPISNQASASNNDSQQDFVQGRGAVHTPRFYRRDIGTAPGRMHEPTAGSDGNIWTSPLDGNLWQYDTRKGTTQIHNLQQLTGRPWKGLHLWPVTHKSQIYLCTPSLAEFHVWNRKNNRVTVHKFPHKQPAVYGGFSVPDWPHLYFYDTRHASVLKWDPVTQTGQHFPCPYELSGTLYMTFIDQPRHEFWGSTYTGNDIVRFDIRRDAWTGHYRCPLADARPTPGGKVFGNMLFASDHLNGRIIPLNADTGVWDRPIAVPGYGDWFGYLSGGWHFRGKLYMCHSTWQGGTKSLDGKPHHFLGSWTVFDPRTREFSRLDIPTRKNEQLSLLMSDYCAVFDNQLFILAVNKQPPHTVIVLQSKPVP